MEKDFSNLTLILTEQCNFGCSYCYQKRSSTKIEISTIDKALDFLFPFLHDNCYVCFTGGEPLLAFDLIAHSVQRCQAKAQNDSNRLRYHLTTNGSLLDDSIIDFLNEYRFSMLVSFDGLSQKLLRNNPSYDHVLSSISTLLKYPDIELRTYTVVTPLTVGLLADSIRLIKNLGVMNIAFGMASSPAWDRESIQMLRDELQSIRGFYRRHFDNSEHISLEIFRSKPKAGIFTCTAGRKRIALTPQGILWGCHLFPDYFKGKEDTPEYKQFCLGELDSFIENHEQIYPQVMANYSRIRMDNMCTSQGFCDLCDDLFECSVCPMYAALAQGNLGTIPDWICQVKKIIREEARMFRQEVGLEPRTSANIEWI